MTTFTTGGSAVTFTTSGSAVSFAVTAASNAFTTSAVLTPGAHASTHGAGGADPITTLGTVTTTLGTVTTLVATTATINAGTAAALVHTGQSIFAAGSAAGPSLAFTGDPNTGIYSPGADRFAVATAGTARFSIGATGSVGVGTDSAGALLHVSGASPIVRITDTDTGVDHRLNADSTTGNLVMDVDYNAEGSTPRYLLSIAGNERMRVDAAGQITTTLGSATSPVLSFSGDTNTGIYSPGADQVGIATAGTARVVVDANGYVGIGETSPGRRLEVKTASVAASETALRLNNTYATSDATASIEVYGNGQLRARTDAGQYATGAGGYYSLWLRDTSPALVQRVLMTPDGLITGTGTSLGAWTSYTPTLGGFTAGSGTPTSGAYCQIGKVVHFRAVWTYGTGSAAASARPTLTLPLTAKNATGADLTAVFFDTSAGAYYQAVAYQTSTTVVTMGVQGALGVSDAASTTSPFTWAAGDTITLSGTFELA